MNPNLAHSSPLPFGILKVCDIDHPHAAIVPRPLLVRANLPDQWWPVFVKKPALPNDLGELSRANPRYGQCIADWSASRTTTGRSD